MEQIRVRGLSKAFRDTLALDSLDLKVNGGEIVGLIGPNGAGKSTALACMGGMLLPDQGQVWLDGKNLFEEPLEARVALGYLPQQNILPSELTALDLQQFLAQLYELQEWEATADWLLNELGLWDVRRKQLKTLSGGQQRKVMLACVLLHQPRCLLLDEPYTGLDRLSVETMQWMIDHARGAGAAVIVSSHLLAELGEMAQRVVVLDRGTVVARAKKGQYKSLAAKEEWSPEVAATLRWLGKTED